MKDFSIALTCFSFLLLVMGLMYKKIKRSVVTEPMVAMAAGILLSPFGFDVLDVTRWGSSEKITEVSCQLTMSMALMATAFRIPKSYPKSNKRILGILVLAGMVGMCLLSTLIIQLIFGFDWLVCFLIGAIITPTDPVVASTIVSGETAKDLLPERIRHAISFESGANDGLAFPLVLLPLLFIKQTEAPWREWFLKVILWESVGAILLGALIGYLTSKALRMAKKANWTELTSLLVFSLSLGFFVLGTLELLNCNGIIGVFAAGLVANAVLDTDEDIEQEEVQEAMERLFTIPIFVLLGLILPWSEWFSLGWKAWLFILAILIFRRLPVLLAMKSLLKNFKTPDLLFMGWFGPVGVAALYYAMHALKESNHHQIWVLTSLIIFSSTVMHGFTGYIFSKLYKKHATG